MAPGEWTLRVDTAQGHFDPDQGLRVEAGGKLELQPHAMALLTQPGQERDRCDTGMKCRSAPRSAPAAA